MLSDSITEKLTTIEEIENRYGQSIVKIATHEDLVCFENWLIESNFKSSNLDFKEYLSLVTNYNGFSFNGLFVYSINKDEEHCIYKENNILWENDSQREHIFFGDDSISWYCLNIHDAKYYVLDKPSGTIMQYTSTFFELLDLALEAVIP